MKILAEFRPASAYPVTWEFKHPHHLITYGLQKKVYWDDLKAAREYGECIRHSLECSGVFDQ